MSFELKISGCFESLWETQKSVERDVEDRPRNCGYVGKRGHSEISIQSEAYRGYPEDCNGTLRQLEEYHSPASRTLE